MKSLSTPLPLSLSCYESGKISTLNNSTLTILLMFKTQQNSDNLHPVEEEELGTEMEKKLPEM